MGNRQLTALLFSGGIDSAALAFQYKPDILILIDYGQVVACGELNAASFFSQELSIPLIVLKADLACIAAGQLAGKFESNGDQHPEWWPFRNQLLVTIAGAWGVMNGVRKLLIGTVKSDRCFSDGTPQFVELMNQVLQCQEGKIHLEAPAAESTSLELITNSSFPRQYLPMCFSCNSSVPPCGICRSCLKYREIIEYCVNLPTAEH